MVGKHRVEGVDFGSPNCPESIFTLGQFFGSFDALGKDSLGWVKLSPALNFGGMHFEARANC